MRSFWSRVGANPTMGIFTRRRKRGHRRTHKEGSWSHEDGSRDRQTLPQAEKRQLSATNGSWNTQGRILLGAGGGSVAGPSDMLIQENKFLLF